MALKIDGTDIVYADHMNNLDPLSLASCVFPTGFTSTRIQNAIDSIPSTGGKIVLRPGQYSIGTTVQMKSGIELIGSSSKRNGGSWFKLNDGVNGDIISSSSSADLTYGTIRNVFLDGNSANNTSGDGIHLYRSQVCWIQNVHIRDVARHGIYLDGAVANIGYHNFIESNGLFSVGSFAIVCGKYNEANLVRGNHVDGAAIGIHLTSALNSIVGNKITTCTRFGIQSISYPDNANQFIGNVLDKIQQHGIQINYQNAIVIGNFLYRVGRTADGVYDAIDCAGSTVASVIVGNHMGDNPTDPNRI